MTMTCKQLGMLAVCGWCLATATLLAQTPVPAQPAPLPAAPATTLVGEDAAPAPDPSRNRPVQKVLNSHGMGCASNFNQLGCGNLCSQLTFMFGSCRTFFSQTCVPNPPHFGAGSGGDRGGAPRKCCSN
jgi:hypothetical protein